MQKQVLHHSVAQVLPKKGDEYWRYTDPKGFLVESGAVGSPDADISNDIFAEQDCIRIVFTDGLFDATLSDELPDLFDSPDSPNAPIQIESLDKVLAGGQKNHWSQDLYGKLENAGQTPVARPFARENTNRAGQGALIHIRKSPSKPIAIHYRQMSPTAAVIHHLIKLDEGVTLTLLESGSAGARANIVTELDIGNRATLHHIRADGTDCAAPSVISSFAKLGEASVYKAFHFGMNTRMHRSEAVIRLTGAGGRASIAAAYIGNGRSNHNDDTVLIIHEAPDCESRQVFKKVLRNGATGVFQGKILVKQIAQKTDGYQIGQALMLDDDSVFLVKPELEIYADDVICSHGSTVGAIEEDALFYLVSRGIRRSDAQNILALAFLAEAVEEIDDAALAEPILDVLRGGVKMAVSS